MWLFTYRPMYLSTYRLKNMICIVNQLVEKHWNLKPSNLICILSGSSLSIWMVIIFLVGLILSIMSPFKCIFMDPCMVILIVFHQTMIIVSSAIYSCTNRCNACFSSIICDGFNLFMYKHSLVSYTPSSHFCALNFVFCFLFFVFSDSYGEMT